MPGTTVIYHNPRCSTSRKTLELLRDNGIEPTVVQYLKTPPSRAELARLIADAGIDAKCHYPIAIHQQEGYPWGKQARIVGPIPNSERNAATCVSLPMFPELRPDEVDYVIEKALAWDKAQA